MQAWLCEIGAIWGTSMLVIAVIVGLAIGILAVGCLVAGSFFVTEKIPHRFKPSINISVPEWIKGAIIIVITLGIFTALGYGLWLKACTGDLF